MLKVVKPCMILEHYQDFDAEKFAEMGYKVLLTDLDNTLVPYDVKVINDDVKAFIQKNAQAGIETIIFSNNNLERVSTFAKDSGVPFYARALKPLKRRYKVVLNEHPYPLNEVICMGDQLLTDVIGANRMHLYSIYVKPIIDRDGWQTKLNRKIERWLFKRMGK